jgi:hypothetical protein
MPHDLGILLVREGSTLGHVKFMRHTATRQEADEAHRECHYFFLSSSRSIPKVVDRIVGSVIDGVIGPLLRLYDLIDLG